MTTSTAIAADPIALSSERYLEAVRVAAQTGKRPKPAEFDSLLASEGKTASDFDLHEGDAKDRLWGVGILGRTELSDPTVRKAREDRDDLRIQLQSCVDQDHRRSIVRLLNEAESFYSAVVETFRSDVGKAHQILQRTQPAADLERHGELSTIMVRHGNALHEVRNRIQGLESRRQLSREEKDELVESRKEFRRLEAQHREAKRELDQFIETVLHDWRRFDPSR